MNQNFVAMLRENPQMRILGIDAVANDHRFLRVRIRINKLQHLPPLLAIRCTNAVDYSIRPPDPNTIEGGPLIEYHEEHTLLQAPHLQCIPGGDGDRFDPPVKFGVLILDQSYIIAERFEVEEPQPQPRAGV